MEFSVSKSALLKKKPQGSADSALGYTGPVPDGSAWGR
jgi:hypothetical protein